MNLSDFDYELPDSFIAQEPLEPRDSSKLMVVDRQTQNIEHRIFQDIVEYINPGDVLVINTTRVIPARIYGFKDATGGKVEFLLLRQLDETKWFTLAGGRNLNPGVRVNFSFEELYAEVIETLGGSERVIRFNRPVNDILNQLGEMPLPPYIHKRLDNSERYQTIYSKQLGSAAAPTAGLHFTPDLLETLRDKGIKTASCVLHVGLDTFQPVRTDHIEQHKMHSERAYLSKKDAQTINAAKKTGRKIIAVGTTTTRTLETAAVLSAGGQPALAISAPDANPSRPVISFDGDTNLFIYPGYRWKVVDSMITNFHLPKSTLLMMISSFAGRELILNAYQVAKQSGYRFFSFGDAMLIV